MLDHFPENEFLELLTELATTPGPSLGEKPRRQVLENFLSQNNIRTETDTSGNLWVTPAPGPWHESVIFDAHLDVVQEGYTASVEHRGNRLVGMGVADNLTAVTMLALLARQIEREKITLKRPLRLLFSVGEEGIGCLKGIRQMVEDHTDAPYLFLAFDLSFEEYSMSALGSRRYSVSVDAPGGHSWDDFGTPGAIDHLIDFVNLFKKAFREIIPAGSIKEASFNVGSIGGGEGINSIARHGELTLEYRSPSQHLLDRLDTATASIAKQMQARKSIEFNIERFDSRPAGAPVNPERIEPVIVELLKQIGHDTAETPRSTSINVPLSKGWPAACMGLCKSGRFHSRDEYVELPSLNDGWMLLDKLCKALCI